MKIAFATLGCPDWTLERIAADARAMGYDGVELRGVAGEHVGPDEPAAERRRIRALFARQGVAIACLSGYTHFATADETQYAASLETAGKLIGLAQELGCPVVRIFAGELKDLDRAAGLRRVAQALQLLAGQAAARQVGLALETHDAWCLGRHLAEVLAAVPDPALGICWDAANSFLQEPLETTAAALKGRIKHVHLKDLISERGRISACLPGKGLVDLRRVLRILQAGNYQGYLSFEWEKKWEPHIEAPEIALPHYARLIRKLLNELEIPPAG